MEIQYHPLKDKINEFLNKFVGKEIVIKANIGDGDVTYEGKDAVGSILEELMVGYLTKKFKHLEEGQTSTPGDIVDRKNDWKLELKAFTKSANFDVYDIPKFFGKSLSKENWLAEAMHKTDYLIFEYYFDPNKKRILKSVSYKKLHEILGYAGKHQISVQYSGGVYKKIRPSSSTKTWTDKTKTPEEFVKYLPKLIKKLPEDLTGNQTELKKMITKQFGDLKKELSKNGE